MQKKFDLADKALVFAAFLFVGFLALKVNYPHNLYIKALLFCAEAALVGGIADWFAVTALFKKPLGFPYHTEIIPRKREQVIDGCIKLVQTEFFTKKQVVLWARESSFIDYIVAYIEKNNYQCKIAGLLLDYFEKILSKINPEKVAEFFESFIREKMRDIDLLPQVKIMIINFIDSQDGSVKFDELLNFIKDKIAEGAIDDKVKAYLEEYLAEQNTGFLSKLMIFFAKQTNVLNVDELADVVKKQLIHNLVNMVDDHNNYIRRTLLDELKNTIVKLPDNREFSQTFETFKMKIVDELSIKDLLSEFVKSVLTSLKRPEGLANALAEQSPLNEFFVSNINHILYVLKTDLVLKNNLENQLNDLISRTLLEGRNMMAIIIREVLEGLSKDEFNSLIYDKVADDLNWIRMNGCIVGATIGGFIFAVLQIVKL